MIDTTKNIQLFLGDCLEVMKEIPDKSIDLIVTDPPYGMNYQSSKRTDKFDKIKLDDNLDWFTVFIKNCHRVLKDNSHIYMFCNDYSLGTFRNETEKTGFKLKRTLIWVKNNHTSGDLTGDYGNKSEFILFAHKGRKPLNGKRDTNILNFNRVSKLQHPTQKPEDLIEYLLEKSADTTCLILDPFMGSGTTGVACKKLNRKFIGIELDENYMKIAQERIKNTKILESGD